MSETAVLAAQRQQEIRNLLRQQDIMRVDEICERIVASPATVRRDLAELDRQGHIRRVHGGAVSIENRLDEPVFDDKASIAAAEKQAIAEAAVKHVTPGSVIYLDGGSTLLTLARTLNGTKDLTVVTNSLRVSSLLAAGGPRLILVGGELRHISQTFVGPLTQPLIEQLSFDIAFMGTMGLSPEQGLTTTDPGEAQTKQLVISRARNVMLLADSSKLGKVSFVTFGDLDQVDTLITDRGATRTQLSPYRKKMNIITAQPKTGKR
jgi:DeoR/GlpR family transcriptional regulator of sugar metabolism